MTNAGVQLGGGGSGLWETIRGFEKWKVSDGFVCAPTDAHRQGSFQTESCTVSRFLFVPIEGSMCDKTAPRACAYY